MYPDVRQSSVFIWVHVSSFRVALQKSSVVSHIYRYGRVEKSYGIFGSVKVIHEYEKASLNPEKINTKMDKTGFTKGRTTTPGTCLQEFHKKFGKRDYTNMMSLDLVNNPGRPLRVQGKKAELQLRAAQLRTAQLETEKTISESKTEVDGAKKKESDSFTSVQEIKRQEKSRAVSPFNTLLLPPAYKLSTTRIVGRRALSAPPFDKKYLQEARSSGLIEKEQHDPQSGNKTDQTPDASRRRPKTAVPIGNKPYFLYISNCNFPNLYEIHLIRWISQIQLKQVYYSQLPY